jgi:hypothetical protein
MRQDINVQHTCLSQNRGIGSLKIDVWASATAPKEMFRLNKTTQAIHHFFANLIRVKANTRPNRSNQLIRLTLR